MFSIKEHNPALSAHLARMIASLPIMPIVDRLILAYETKDTKLGDELCSTLVKRLSTQREWTNSSKRTELADYEYYILAEDCRVVIEQEYTLCCSTMFYVKTLNDRIEIRMDDKFPYVEKGILKFQNKSMLLR